MLIQVIWPELQRYAILTEHHQRETPLWFSPSNGSFSEQADRSKEQIALWFQHQEVMVSTDDNVYSCLIDGQPLATGQTHPLRNGMVIQAGHFLLKVVEPKVSELAANLQTMDDKVPELELLINHGGHYTPYNYDDGEDNDFISEDDDPLKSLAREYKHHLLWGEHQHTSNDVHLKGNKYKSERLKDTLNVNERLKDKTISECVIAADVMMDRIFKELVIGQDDILETDKEESVELLREIAPDHLKKIEKKAASELLSRENHKLGLDSHL